MTEFEHKSDWRTRIWKSSATGWLAFGLLVVVVVVAALMLGGNPSKGPDQAAQTPQTTTR
jgi:hypothetical protein